MGFIYFSPFLSAGMMISCKTGIS